MTATPSFAPRAIIIGGSTAGLLIGALLRRRGWHIDVFERSPVELAGRGAGIGCHPELFHALDESGAGTDAIGIDVAERIAFDDNGSIIGRLAFPQTVTSWDRLYQLVRKVVPDSYYHLDHALLGVEQDADGVRATFTNGRQVEGELLVGVDGFRSSVRQQFLPTISPQYAGYTIWRGLADEAALHPDIRNIVFERFAFHLPAGAEILGYPIAGPGNDLHVGKRRYNWVWYRKTSEVELDDMLTDDSGTTIPWASRPHSFAVTSSPGCARHRRSPSRRLCAMSCTGLSVPSSRRSTIFCRRNSPLAALR
jgi:2-polyprenyl-6-methoxyphenol hydroxylase-like FAD-dependent oxidoreductase